MPTIVPTFDNENVDLFSLVNDGADGCTGPSFDFSSKMIIFYSSSIFECPSVIGHSKKEPFSFVRFTCIPIDPYFLFLLSIIIFSISFCISSRTINKFKKFNDYNRFIYYIIY